MPGNTPGEEAGRGVGATVAAVVAKEVVEDAEGRELAVPDSAAVPIEKKTRVVRIVKCNHVFFLLLSESLYKIIYINL